MTAAVKCSQPEWELARIMAEWPEELAMTMVEWPEEPALPGADGTSQLPAGEDPGQGQEWPERRFER